MVRQDSTQKNSPLHTGLLIPFSTLVQLMLAMLFLCTLASSVQAKLTATADRVNVTKDDVLTLTLRSTKGQIDDRVDLSVLRKDFSILNSQRKNQLSFVNGKRTANYDLILTIAPNRSGTLTIPSFNANGETSKPIRISVSDKATNSSGELSEVFLDNQVNKQEVYVQEQILYTLKIYHSVGLSDANLSPLELKNAVVKQLGDQIQYEAVLKGIRYAVIEINYAVFPEASGRFEIPPQTLTARTSARRNDFFRPSGKYKRIQSPTQIISVIPKPASYPANTPWLPAEKLEISDSWKNKTPALKVGESITRSLGVRALGLSSAQLPDLTIPEINGVKRYPDQAQSNDKTSAAGITGQKVQATALVPQRSGGLHIPGKTLYWWNTKTDQLETSQISEIEVNVVPEEVASSSPLYPPIVFDPTINLETTNSPQSNNSSLIWPAIACLFALLWLATLYLWWKSNKRVRAHNSFTPALSDIGKTTDKELYKALQNACQTNDPRSARALLISWFREHFNTDSIHNLEDIRALNGHPSLTIELAELEACLYSRKGDNSTWQGQPLSDVIDSIKKTRKSTPKQQTNNALKPLYPI